MDLLYLVAYAYVSIGMYCSQVEVLLIWSTPSKPDTANVTVNSPRPQQTPGLFHPLCPVVSVLNTKSAVLRLASTTRVMMEVMKKMMWSRPPSSSNMLRSCLNHKLNTKGTNISPHMINVVCHAFG